MQLQILAKKNGFRRLGRSFSDTVPTFISSKDKLTEEEIQTLKSDPSLLVVEVSDDAAIKKAEQADGVAQKQLEEAQKSLEAVSKDHGTALKEIATLKDALEAEKTAHGKTAKALESVKAELTKKAK